MRFGIFALAIAAVVAGATVAAAQRGQATYSPGSYESEWYDRYGIRDRLPGGFGGM